MFVLGALSVALAAGCQMSSVQAVADSSANVLPARHSIVAPMAWGGEMRCGVRGCYLGVVEHEASKLALHRIDGHKSTMVDRQPLAYHPDSAAWINDDLLVAAVEETTSLDVFKLEQGRLVRIQQIGIAIPPRDVIWLQSSGSEHQMLAVPYSGKKVAWVRWQESSGSAARVQWADWCASPWHPTKINRMPQSGGAGIAVACLDDRAVIALSQDQWLAKPRVLARFSQVPRQVRPTPSGKWLYVALEAGGKNARMDMDSGEIQWLDAPEAGSVSVLPIDDELVIWGGDQSLLLQRLDSDGSIKEARWMQTSGFSTGLQLIDANQDGEQDVVVFNSSGTGVDILFGPIWSGASTQMPGINTH